MDRTMLNSLSVLNQNFNTGLSKLLPARGHGVTICYLSFFENNMSLRTDCAPLGLFLSLTQEVSLRL